MQPRLSGLTSFHPCSLSSDPIPVGRCQPLEGAVSRDQIRELYRGLLDTLEEKATPDELQAAALTRLAFGARTEAELLAAAANLREAALNEADPVRQANIRSDLAAAHLLLAEVLQSPLQDLSALDEALRALELKPGLAEAEFNRELALQRLGMAPIELGTGDPWLRELRGADSTGTSRLQAGSDCASISQVRELLDRWSELADRQPAPAAIFAAACPLGADQSHQDLSAAAERAPTDTARAWRAFSAADTALRAFDLAAAARHLTDLESLDPPELLRLEARWIEATINYQNASYEQSVEILLPLARMASERKYFELSARSYRLAGLIGQVTGDYGSGLDRVNLALAEARKTESPRTLAAIFSILIELQELVGEEDEAWRTIVTTLRSLDSKTQTVPRLLCLQSAARLAKRRGFLRVARQAHEEAIAITTASQPVLQISALKERGQFLADLGEPGAARDDLETSRRLLAGSEISSAIKAAVESDLDLLEGRVAIDLKERREALERALESFEATTYRRQFLQAKLALAETLKAEDAPDAAIRLLQEALGDLRGLVAKVRGWPEATGLVAGARPLADELIGLLLDRGDERGAWEALASYSGLQAGAPIQRDLAAMRLSYFIRPTEVVVFFETPEAGLQVFRRPVPYQRLSDLRDLLMLYLRQRRNDSAERIKTATAQLAKLLIPEFAKPPRDGDVLHIVIDDLVAGLPFAILPMEDGQLMIDRYAIAYATDFRRPSDFQVPKTMLAVGSNAAEGSLRPLEMAENEARKVCAIYGTARCLDRTGAGVPEVRAGLATSPEAVHIAAHFVVNGEEPMRSYFVLPETAGGSSRLRLEDLLHGSPRPPRLLYLSGCDTGRGLPTSASGIVSLAQILTSEKVAWSVVSLWPLGDRPGQRLAVAFQDLLAQGKPVATALREVQLQAQREDVSAWAALAAFY